MSLFSDWNLLYLSGKRPNKKKKKKKLESLSIPNLDLSEKIGKVVTK